MSREIYTEAPRDANSDLPLRAGELLPELFRRYLQRAEAAAARPATLVDERVAPRLGISMVAVKSAGHPVVTGVEHQGAMFANS